VGTYYNRLRKNPPQFDAFEQEFGKYMYQVPTGDLVPNGDQLQAAAKKARTESAASRDA